MYTCDRCGARFDTEKLLWMHKRICTREPVKMTTIHREQYREFRQRWKDLPKAMKGIDFTPDVGQMPDLGRKCLVCGKEFSTQNFDKLTCSDECEAKFKDSKMKAFIDKMRDSKS